MPGRGPLRGLGTGGAGRGLLLALGASSAGAGARRRRGSRGPSSWASRGLHDGADMLNALSEKELFVLSTLPPLLGTLVVLWLLRGSPQPLLESIAHLLPAVKHMKFFEDGNVCFELESAGDLFATGRLLFSRVQEQVSSQVQRKSRSVLGLFAAEAARKRAAAAGGPEDLPRDARAGEERGKEALRRRELWINLRHLVGTAAVPVFFLLLFFWDAAFIHRRASVDFPLLHCMNPDTSHCFYIEQDYSFWRYPTWKRLECEAMRERTVKSPEKFVFVAPDRGHFYKCYINKFCFAALVSAAGDAMALTALCGVVIVRFSIQITHVEVRGACQREKILRMKRNCHIQMVLFAALLAASAFIVDDLYGRWTNDFVFYLFFPGLCCFSLILLWNRREILNSRIKAIDKAEDVASPDVEEAEEDAVSSGSSAQDESPVRAGPSGRCSRGAALEDGELLVRRRSQDPLDAKLSTRGLRDMPHGASERLVAIEAPAAAALPPPPRLSPLQMGPASLPTLFVSKASAWTPYPMLNEPFWRTPTSSGRGYSPMSAD